MGSKIGVLKIAAKRIGIDFKDYIKKINQGLKYCYKCKNWKTKKQFCKDSARGDGLSSLCKSCRYERKTSDPGKIERAEMLKKGFAWCSGCKKWLPSKGVRQGKCRHHHNEYARKRYRESEPFRKSRKNRSAQYRRNVAPIPIEGIKVLEEKFNGKCAYCGKPATTYDHIVPVSKGGQTTPGNIVPACNSCNSSKKTKDIMKWLNEKGIEPNDQVYETMILGASGLYG